MDVILSIADEFVFNKIYPEHLKPDDVLRQTISLFFMLTIGGSFLYLGGAYANYVFIFDKTLLKHSKILPHQISKEITCSMSALPIMSILTIPFFLAELQGYTLLYDDFSERSVGYTIWSVMCFMFWNDFLIYWIHRGLHSKLLYKPLHKEHHRWLVPTPFASHAFHPVDGWAQSLPYHMFTFMMPLNKWIYIGAFVIVNFWTISIHDGNYHVPGFLKSIINGAAHHTDHHLYFNYNYGQYFTLWDRIGGSFRNPSPYEGNGPYDDLKNKAL